MAIATAVNIVLDLLLVGPLGMGTKGAAYATIFSHGISFVISVIHLKRNNFVFDFQLRHFTVKPDKLAAIMKVGLPTAIQMIVVNLSYLLITGMLNQFGVTVAAASGVGLKINTFAGMPCWAIGQALSPLLPAAVGLLYFNRKGWENRRIIQKSDSPAFQTKI